MILQYMTYGMFGLDHLILGYRLVYHGIITWILVGWPRPSFCTSLVLMRDEVVMVQPIPFLKPTKCVRFGIRIRWSIHCLVPQTKNPVSWQYSLLKFEQVTFTTSYFIYLFLYFTLRLYTISWSTKSSP